MRSLVLACVIALAATPAIAPAQPAWFAAQLQCNNVGTFARCEVINPAQVRILCNVQIHGQLASGLVISSNLNDFVYPGTFKHVYIYAPQTNPIVNAYGSGNCHYAP